MERSSLDKTIITSINTLQIGTVDDYDYVIHSKVVYEAAAARRMIDGMIDEIPGSDKFGVFSGFSFCPKNISGI